MGRAGLHLAGAHSGASGRHLLETLLGLGRKIAQANHVLRRVPCVLVSCAVPCSILSEFPVFPFFVEFSGYSILFI